ncbi:stage II sporulation protein M [Neptuniibacter caesariensis]|uniref:Integral membrane protein n=1 Tax=Neptuniibacter caesariensis TaxID=207954 RepID=A0A7U8C4T9_NEPCE|nr:stage II sporulation protein M [Neptuniibacter caesariensis]EAR61229.1 integral membrane protein [Oceanospirillum sp. MED92] [Neptuniibacter caesariensis]
MKQIDFDQKYSPIWKSFEADIDNHNGRKAKLDPAFPENYRKICNHLSLARQRHYSEELIDYLNQLVMAGHHALYKQDNRIKLGYIGFALNVFIFTLRKYSKAVWLSTALFIMPGLLMGLACFYDETIIYSLMSPSDVAEFESMYDPSLDKIGRERGSDTDLMMFGYYIKNNIGIAFRTFAGGIFFGLGSVFFLCFNGLYIGAVAGRLTSIGYGVTFYPFVVGHGAFELTAIVFSGAAGLIIGYALINPGQQSRLTALKNAARDAVKIMYGAAFMLLIAAFLEAFWSSSTSLPVELKYAVGAGLWFFVIWLCFLSPLGRQREPN